MIFNIILPTMIELAQAVLRWLLRKWDQWGAGPSGTRLVSIQSYVDLYGGPEFEVHYRFANVLNIIFVTMMYGTAIPILFPIAALSFLVIYIKEVYMLYYVYKAPPTYDEKLNE